jgi:hypothetical protein
MCEFKTIIEILNNLKLKLTNNKHVDQVVHYNFSINYVNIHGQLWYWEL